MTSDILSALRACASPQRAALNARFFKTGPGQYGEGDRFWGLTVPQIRKVISQYRDLPLDQIEILLHNETHEVRLAAVLLLVHNYPRYPEEVYKIYLANTRFINNWDLVDLSAPRIVGVYLENKPKKILEKLARSKSVWERRISMISTFNYIYKGSSTEALKIAGILIDDSHDLIRKAVGWMLREIGKRCSREIEEEFLEKYAATMPRTTLRYAIEHFPPEKRQYYLHK